MTEVFDESGQAQAVTVVKVAPVTVTRVKAPEQDGYHAVQVGFGTRRASNINKAQREALKDLGSFAALREFRLEESPEVAVGDKIDLGAFTLGDKVVVRAISKSKGFQGVVKRHGFGGGPRSHGQKHSEREPGSIGGGGRDGGRVAKGMRMAGRMGGDLITIKNLSVVHLDPENNELYIKGAVPGRRGTLVEIISKS